MNENELVYTTIEEPLEEEKDYCLLYLREVDKNTKLKSQIDEVKLYYKEKIRWTRSVLRNDCCDLQFEHEIYLKEDLINSLEQYKEFISKLEEVGK